MVQTKFDHRELVLDANAFKCIQNPAKIWKCVNQHEFKWMYDMPYKGIHFGLNLSLKIHILPIYGQTDPKTATVPCRVGNQGVMRSKPL